MSYAPQILGNSISFEDVQMILLPFCKISQHIRLRKMPLSSGIQGQWSMARLTKSEPISIVTAYVLRILTIFSAIEYSVIF